MIPAAFDYQAPTTIEEALTLLAANNQRVTGIAGVPPAMSALARTVCVFRVCGRDARDPSKEMTNDTSGF
jgi:hypothetical protein